MSADPSSVPPAAAHPGPPVVRLPRALAEAIVAQARDEAPNEACGIIAGSAGPAAGGVALRYESCRNELASPARYSVHPEDLLRVLTAIDRAGEAIWAVVHSHVRTAAVPSPLDVELAQLPDVLYLVVSLAGSPASVRAWRIVRGGLHEVRVEIA